jgi:hypothetical protein
VADVNALIATDVPAAYKQMANKEWPRKVKPVPASRR